MVLALVAAPLGAQTDTDIHLLSLANRRARDGRGAAEDGHGS
jgi:hypothetical protein